MGTISSRLSDWVRRGALAALGVACLCAAGPAEARVRRVIHVSVDGLRGDYLKELVNDPVSRFFTFRRFQTEGAVTYNARCDFSHSITTPNHTSMITGRPVVVEDPLPKELQHGYLTNYTVPTDILHIQGSPPGYKASTFDRVHDRGLRTGLFLSKEKMRIFERSYGPVHGAPDLDGEDNGQNKIDVSFIRENNTPAVISALLREIDARTLPAYTFLHLCDPDYAGHTAGWSSIHWKLAVKTADTQLGVLLAALDADPELKAETAIILTADHGGGVPDTTHVDPTAIQNITIPVILWGPGIAAGVDAHTLFSNRADPGANRISNTDPVQPLRNGDTGNIAMALLGLPPVEGSFHRPEFKPVLTVQQNAAGNVTVRWPQYLEGMTLEASDSLLSDDWKPVEAPPAEVNGYYQHAEPAVKGGRRFFRLKASSEGVATGG